MYVTLYDRHPFRFKSLMTYGEALQSRLRHRQYPAFRRGSMR
jgi:hypothetical protein